LSHAETVSFITRSPGLVCLVGSNVKASDPVESPVSTWSRKNRWCLASQRPTLTREVSRAPVSANVRMADSFVSPLRRTTSVKVADLSRGSSANARASVPSLWTWAIIWGGAAAPGRARVIDSPAALEKSAGCVADGLGEGVQLGEGEAVHVGEAVGLQLGDADGVHVGDAVGPHGGDAVGVQLGEAVGVHVGEPVGVGSGVDVQEGEGVGDGARSHTTTVIGIEWLSVPPATLTSRNP
jgi:hypothetical protein